MPKPQPIRLGILTPSSNTALEPLTHTLLASFNTQQSTYYMTAHFSRFPVTTISLSPSGLAQFNLAPILAAAELLAHAEVDIIGWSGTSAGWLGFDKDIRLCEEIEKATGIRATTSILALNKALELWGITKLGLITPYQDDVQMKIMENYAAIGVVIEEGMEKHLRVVKNTDIAEIGEKVLDELVKDVVGNRVDAVSTFCTNLVAAQRVDFWEKEHGIPVFDTVATVIWDMLTKCGVDARGLNGWGMIFQKG
jgi:maleate isomerase